MEKWHRPVEEQPEPRALFEETPGSRPFTVEEHRRLLEAFRPLADDRNPRPPREVAP